MTRWRRWLLAFVLWLYGISISVTLVSVWGRALVVDTDLMAEGAVAAADSDVVADRIENWLRGELVAAPQVGSELASDAVDTLTSEPSVSATIEDLIRRVVEAAAAPEGESTVVDVGEVLSPAVPAVTDALNDKGYQLSEEQVGAALTNLDPLEVRDPEAAPLVGSGSGAATALYLATVIGLALAGVSGAAAVRLSEDSRAMLRSLFSRIAVSALGFAVMFRLGSWILDPGAGRAPAREAASRLAGSNLWIPVVISASAAVVARVLHVRRRNGGGTVG